MAKETLEQLIDRRRTEYQDKNRVAFIGKVSSGKTVTAALLKYTLSKLWIPKTNGKWESVTSSGYDEINEILREMKKGEFPSATLRENYPKLVLDIFNMEGQPTKFELILHDMSGENYSDLLTSSSYASIDDRLLEILSGDGAYLAFAKKYVIMLDCEEKEDWDTDIAKVAPMISTIRTIQQKIHNYGPNEQIHSPIAIVFTKSDLLSPEDQAKTAEELAKEYHELISSLKINHDQNSLSFFKVSVLSNMETETDVAARIKKNEDMVKKEHEKRLKIWEEQIETAIEQAVSEAKTQAQQQGQNEEQIKATIENTKQQTQEKYKQQFDQKYPLENQKDEHELKWKVNVPLTYTESEYIKFISWILDIKNEE